MESTGDLKIMSERDESLFPRTLDGGPVSSLPGGCVPARQPLQGRHVRLEPMDPERHTDELFAASHASHDARAVWTYLPEGPWPDRDAYARSIQRVLMSWGELRADR